MKKVGRRDKKRNGGIAKIPKKELRKGRKKKGRTEGRKGQRKRSNKKRREKEKKGDNSGSSEKGRYCSEKEIWKQTNKERKRK